MESREQGSKGTREQGNEKTGSKGTKEQGSERLRDGGSAGLTAESQWPMAGSGQRTGDAMAHGAVLCVGYESEFIVRQTGQMICKLEAQNLPIVFRCLEDF